MFSKLCKSEKIQPILRLLSPRVTISHGMTSCKNETNRTKITYVINSRIIGHLHKRFFFKQPVFTICPNVFGGVQTLSDSNHRRKCLQSPEANRSPASARSWPSFWLPCPSMKYEYRRVMLMIEQTCRNMDVP